MTDLPDVTDPDVRAMVLADHEPMERWILRVGGSRLVTVACRCCWSPWPCPSIVAARAVERAHPNPTR